MRKINFKLPAIKNTKLMTNMTRGIYKTGFQLKKCSPEILVVTGVIGVVASTVMACKATTKVSGILEETKKSLDTVHEVAENPEMAEKYTEEDSKKDLAIIYVQTGVKMVKLYAPAVIVGAASLGCILKSHNIMSKRNVALAAAYATVDRSFKDYRGRVIERFGEGLDRELKYNIKAKEVEEIVIDEKGEEKKETKILEVADINPSEYSAFARFFDEACAGWTKDAEHNLRFVKLQQNYANEKLKRKGYLFLNDVYEMLGIPKTKAGHVVGWIYDKENPVGDNYIDFGIYNIESERARAFVNGYERNILLDFNVDGNILKLIKEM